MQLVKKLLTRLRFLKPENTRHQIDEELQFHLEHQIAQNIAAGMSPSEAARQAAIAFGALERAREDCQQQRPGFWFETFLQDVRYALRGFRRNPTFTVTIIATLMLGIGATTAVFSIVDRILFRSLPYPRADRLVSLGFVQPLETQEFMLGYFYYDWRDNQKPFVSLTSESAVTRECDLNDANPTQLSCPSVEANFLPTLGISPIIGRNFLPEEDRPNGPEAAIITYALWLAHYNRDPGILNKTIELDGNPVRVVGVLPKDFAMPRLQDADVLLPMARDEAADRRAFPGGPRRAFARLKPGVTIEQARAELEPLFQNAQKQIPPEIRNDIHLKVRSLRDRQMQTVRPAAWILFAVAIAVLLIACANVAGLLMARNAARARELAVRSALGATRARLARQGLTEALLFSLFGAGGGCLLAEALLRLFVAIAPTGIPFLGKAHLDLRVLSFTFLVSILCAILLGVVPALQKPTAQMLTSRAPGAIAQVRVRQGLVVAQIAISMVLLTGATLLLRSFLNLQNEQLGIRADNTLTASITLGQHNYPDADHMLAFFQHLTTRLQFGPGVKLVSVSDTLPPAPSPNDRRYESIVAPGQPPPKQSNGGIVAFRWVSPEYFRALDIPILQGPGFTQDQLTSSDRFVVLSQDLATRLFPGKNPIGRQLQLDAPDKDAPWYTVVGVAANVKNGGLTGEQHPEYYRLRRNRPEDWSLSGVWGRTSTIVIATTLPPEQMSRWIRSQVAALDPTLPVDIATLRQRVGKLADAPRFQTVLVGFFAATGLALAVIGLYGVIAFLVTQRTPEIGLRMAVGATHADILTLVIRSGLRLILPGVALGLLAALAVTRLLSALLFGIGPHDPIALASVTAALIVVALAATLIPAAGAARVDPTVALRND